MEWIIPAAIFICAAGLGVLITGIALRALRRYNILDHPNPRSSHHIPIPRGGGLAVVPLVLLLWLLLSVFGICTNVLPISSWIWLAAATMLIGLVSWIDDFKGLSQTVRFISHIIAIALVLAVTPAENLYFQGLLPKWADMIAAGFIWLWFVNLFNFMDGIDGISGIETVSISIGVAIVGSVAVDHEGLNGLALALAGAATGFLWWNWQPARIFLGDVGAVPLGFILGWMLLELAAGGAWLAAVILPLYYFLDATITLCRRAMRGEKFWQAHRQHFYQKAAREGMSHSRISVLVAIANIGLITMALEATDNVYAPLLGALIITGGLLWALRGGRVTA